MRWGGTVGGLARVPCAPAGSSHYAKEGEVELEGDPASCKRSRAVVKEGKGVSVFGRCLRVRVSESLADKLLSKIERAGVSIPHADAVRSTMCGLFARAFTRRHHLRAGARAVPEPHERCDTSSSHRIAVWR